MASPRLHGERLFLACGIFGLLLTGGAVADEAAIADEGVQLVSADFGAGPFEVKVEAVLRDGAVQGAAVAFGAGAAEGAALPPAPPSSLGAGAAASLPHVVVSDAVEQPAQEAPAAAVMPFEEAPQAPFVGAQGTFCDMAEGFYMSLIASQCPDVTGDVTCVYTSLPDCSIDDICNMRKGCGYVEDNAFVKFDGFECQGSGGFGPQGPTGTFQIMCKPVVTPEGVGLIIGTCFAALLGCVCCVWCCCCRSRR